MLDHDRFEKCLALSRRGATEGERSAALAAATRVAASAGMTLVEATALVEGVAPTRDRSAPPPSSPYPRQPFSWPRKKEPAKPITIEEILAQRAAGLARKKAAAAREEKRMRKLYAEQDREHVAIREAQAQRDREWAGARRQGA